MHYGAIKPCDIANGLGVRVSLFVSGCRHRCQNCFNPETWAFRYGQPYTEETTQQILKMMMAETSRVFEQLPIVEDVEILRNILYAGVWSRYGQIRCSRKGTDKKE